MTEHTYRTIADTTTHPDLTSAHAARGDRLVHDVIDGDRWTLVRIERPVSSTLIVHELVDVPAPRTSERQRTIREFNGDDVWRDDEGTVWVRQSELVEAVTSDANHPPTRDQIDSAVGVVLFNVSNYPTSAQSHLWGHDIGPLRRMVTDAVMNAVPSVPTREQIAEAIASGIDDGSSDDADVERAADAVLALIQNGADR